MPANRWDVRAERALAIWDLVADGIFLAEVFSFDANVGHDRIAKSEGRRAESLPLETFSLCPFTV